MRISAVRNLRGAVVERADVLAMTAMVAFAVATVFTTGFMQESSTVHEVFHDLRHALGLPCH
jgi:cobalt transporter subunit CbtB